MIVRTTKDWCEKYSTKVAVMLVGPLLTGANSGPGAVGWNSVRAIDSNGDLVFVQNPDAAETGTTDETVMLRSTAESIKCRTKASIKVYSARSVLIWMHHGLSHPHVVQHTKAI